MKNIFFLAMCFVTFFALHGCDRDSKPPSTYEQPLPNEKKVEYDENNRINKITYPDGTVETFIFILNQ